MKAVIKKNASLYGLRKGDVVEVIYKKEGWYDVDRDGRMILVKKEDVDVIGESKEVKEVLDTIPNNIPMIISEDTKLIDALDEIGEVVWDKEGEFLRLPLWFKKHKLGLEIVAKTI